MKTRRIFGILVALAFALSLVWWLFHDTYPHRTTPTATLTEIRFAYCGGLEDDEFWRRTIDEFEKANPDVRIKLEYVAGLVNEYENEFLRQVLNDTLPDVALVQQSTFQEFSEHFEDLTERFSADFSTGLEPTGLWAFQVQREQRGIPFSGGNLLIFLNRRSFQKASEFHGKPVEFPDENWTVAQFLRTAEALTCDFDRDGQTDQFGLRLPRWEYYLPFIWSFGADITDDQASRWTFSGPAAKSVMRFYRQLATGDRVAPREGEVSPLSQDMGFLTGKTAMCINGPGFLPILDKSDMAGNYAVAPIPRGPGGRATRIRWDGIVMQKNLPPERRDKAWRFIEWTLSKEIQGRLALLGRALPARVDMQREFIAADPLQRKPFIDALSFSRLQPTLPQFESLDRAITRHFNDAIDSNRAFDAQVMLDALARNPAVISAFSGSPSEAP